MVVHCLWVTITEPYAEITHMSKKTCLCVCVRVSMYVCVSKELLLDVWINYDETCMTMAPGCDRKFWGWIGLGLWLEFFSIFDNVGERSSCDLFDKIWHNCSL